jgi:hypothetical protein
MDEPRDDLDEMLASYRRAIEPSAESEARVRDALRTAIPSWSTPPNAEERGAVAVLLGRGRGRHVLAVGGALAAALVLAFGVTSLLGERRDVGRDLAQTPFLRSDAGPAQRRVETTRSGASAPMHAVGEDAASEAPASDDVAAVTGAADVEEVDGVDEVEAVEEDDAAEAAERGEPSEAAAPRRARAASRRVDPEPSTEPEPAATRVETEPAALEPAQENAPALDLARELRLIREAEGHLQAGRHAQALAAIERHAADFPRGQLEPEREASRVTALCLRGREDEAQARAETFAARWPASPLLPRVRRVCDN